MWWLIFCVNFTELQGTCPDVWSNIVPGVSGRVFLDEINLSKCDNVTYQPGAIPGVANVINNKRCHMLMLVCPFSKFFCHWNVSDGEIGQAKWIFWLLEVIFLLLFMVSTSQGWTRKYKENGKAASSVLGKFTHGQSEMSPNAARMQNTAGFVGGQGDPFSET